MNAWEIKREVQIPMWQERIKACRSSGMTVKDWCKKNGITKQTYYAWEKHCLQRVSNNKENSTNAIIKVIPEEPSNGEMAQKPEEATAPTELVIRCGCVSMDISPQMSVTKIAELVSALNSHV